MRMITADAYGVSDDKRIEVMSKSGTLAGV